MTRYHWTGLTAFGLGILWIVWIIAHEVWLMWREWMDKNRWKMGRNQKEDQNGRD
jgi:hypothetical protein